MVTRTLFLCQFEAALNLIFSSKLPCAFEQKNGTLRCRQHPGSPIAAFPNNERRLSLMYNPLGPWNAWFALTSQPARIYLATQAGMLRGIAQAGAKAETETNRMAAQIPAAARKSNKKRRVARKAVAVAAKSDRRNRHRVRVLSGRVVHRAKKIQKRSAA
jgi:hypothetical protein